MVTAGSQVHIMEKPCEPQSSQGKFAFSNPEDQSGKLENEVCTPRRRSASLAAEFMLRECCAKESRSPFMHREGAEMLQASARYTGRRHSWGRSPAGNLGENDREGMMLTLELRDVEIRRRRGSRRTGLKPDVCLHFTSRKPNRMSRHDHSRALIFQMVPLWTDRTSGCWKFT